MDPKKKKPFEFMEPVHSPCGDGYFIHPFIDGIHCQVAIRQDGIQRNPVFRLADISKQTAAKPAHHSRLQQADTDTRNTVIP